MSRKHSLRIPKPEFSDCLKVTKSVCLSSETSRQREDPRMGFNGTEALCLNTEVS